MFGEILGGQGRTRTQDDEGFTDRFQRRVRELPSRHSGDVRRSVRGEGDRVNDALAHNRRPRQMLLYPSPYPG